ncbi:MAG: cytidine deaminase [Planctomycetota bacterium]|nr:cytidine deaminase [Planctomycetota bacterium]MDA1177780.1 cytidine deaminase [Planctomycetota bacterium]
MTPDPTLIQAALEVRQNAYARYSNFSVGAALWARAVGRAGSPTLFVGCNVENQSYGLTICAERCAIGNAVAAGYREITEIAIATAGGVTPCGACRQVMAEFSSELIIWLVDADQPQHSPHVTTLLELLPNRFRFDDRTRG